MQCITGRLQSRERYFRYGNVMKQLQIWPLTFYEDRKLSKIKFLQLGGFPNCCFPKKDRCASVSYTTS